MAAVLEAVLLIVVILVYTLVAVRIGSKILSYRSAWLDGSGVPNHIVKFILCLLFGWLVSGFFLAWMLIKWVIALLSR